MLAFTALPLIYVVLTAFKPLDELLRFPPTFFVSRPTMTNFSDLVTTLGSSDVPFLRYIFNSLLTTVITVFLSVIVCCMGAYGMVKHKVPFSNFIFLIIVSALMFSGHVTQISNFMIVNSLGLVDTYWALIIPKIAVAFNFFMVKQFIEQMPDAYLEAARIDGAGETLIFTRLVMPYLRPAVATLTVFSFVNNWNDYFSPLIFITKEQLKTLPLALQSIGESGNIARAGAMAAATFLMTLPTILVFSFMQRQVIQTMAHSGIKA
ncbi:MAG: carbohydrate ABC transporter permease [Clostridia bacterium]|nr:carbohydrate ABC transporter permease [Clostridia bacterium]